MDDVRCSIFFISKAGVYMVCHLTNKGKLLFDCLLCEDMVECAISLFEILGGLDMLTLGQVRKQ